MPCLYTQSHEAFMPTEYAGSPWHPRLLHGSAVSALFAFHLQRRGLDYPGFQLSRLGIAMLRPVPKAPLRMEQEVVRDGNRLKLVDMKLYDDQRLVARAEIMWQKRQQVTLPEYTPALKTPPPGPEGQTPLDIQQMLQDKGLPTPPGFHSHVQVRQVTPWNERGNSTSWVHWPHAIVDEQPVSQLEQVCLLSDLGNGTGQFNFQPGMGTINADIQLSLHRNPVSDWLALSSRILVTESGIGVIKTDVFDQQGEIGALINHVQPNGEYSG